MVDDCVWLFVLCWGGFLFVGCYFVSDWVICLSVFIVFFCCVFYGCL